MGRGGGGRGGRVLHTVQPLIIIVSIGGVESVMQERLLFKRGLNSSIYRM